ncbi:MAG TPA: hypothetical protein VLH79_14215 [Chthonomonadales bacterium]|nr:hypothetical protein [Chthonomonadales bacterium]
MLGITRIALVTLALSAAALAAPPTLAAPPAQAQRMPYPDIMPLSQVRAGMKGYGLTVFRGTAIERFEVEVVDVVRQGSLVVPGRDMILVRLSGGPITARRAYAVRGMSGSPIFINGKLIGAYSQAEPSTKEALGGVTPIEDMLEAWDPRLPTRPFASRPPATREGVTLALERPIRVGSRVIDRIVYDLTPDSPVRSSGRTLAMRRCAGVLAVPVASRAVRERLAALLAPYGVEVTRGGAPAGRIPGFAGAPIVPGAALAMMLIAGDNPLPATGTVTYRRGDRILAFGHAFLNVGPIEAPIASAFIHDIYPLLSGTYKISSPGPVVGSSVQDRQFAIAGVVGRKPSTIDVTVDVNDVSTGRKKIYRSQVVSHPNLSAALVSVAVGSAIADIRSTPGAAMARVQTSVDLEELGTVERENVVFDMRAIDAAALGDLDDIASAASANPFYPVAIRSVSVKVEIEGARRTAAIDRVFVREGRFEPGQTVDVGVVLRPYRNPPVTRTLRLTIPRTAPAGRMSLVVRGGAVAPPLTIGGLVIRPTPVAPPERAPPTSLRQIVDRLLERERGNEIAARLILPTTAVNVDGKRLSGLPPSLDAAMRSARSSSVRLDREDVRVVEATEWVVSGQQALTIQVERRDGQEAPAQPTPQPPPVGGPAVPPGAAFHVPFDDDLSAATALGALEDGVLAALQARSASREAAPVAPPRSGQAGPPRVAGQAAPVAAAPVVPAPATQTPVSRLARVWKQTSRADFEKGDLQGVSVTSKGDLRLTRTLRNLHAGADSFAWSMARAADGAIVVGTGGDARVWRLEASGLRELARLPEVAVHAVLGLPDGAVLAATAPNGRTYRIAPDGKAEVMHDAAEPYALALALDASGTVVLGAGGGQGVVYRAGADGKPAVWFRTPDEHVLALAAAPDGGVIAGTAPNGVVYRIAPDGRASVLLDAPEQSITAVAVTAAGDVWAATAPRGVLYRIRPGGTSEAVYTRAAGPLSALIPAPDGGVFAAGGSAIIAAAPDGTVTTLDNPQDIDVISLAMGADGTLYAGAGGAADLFAAAPIANGASGTLTSEVHDARLPSRWGAVRWNASVPEGAALRIETRSGETTEPDDSWSSWSPPRSAGGEGAVATPPSRFLQWRATLTASPSGASPLLRDIAVAYLPRNQAPRVAFQLPAGGERWARQQTVRWDSSDPDRDALAYELLYSADNGVTWRPAPSVTAAPAPAPPAVTPPAAPAAQPAAPARRVLTVAQVRAELDRHPNVPSELREAILRRAEEVNAAAPPAGAATPPAGVAAAPAQPAAATPQPSATQRAIDTARLPDGPLRLKVVASDRPANGAGALTAEAISESFIVCNEDPALYVFGAETRVNPDRTASLAGAALQKHVAVVAVQYRVDGGAWVAATPEDGIFDSQIEGYRIVTEPLASGTRRIEVKAFSAAGVTSTETVEVTVP